MRLSIATAVGAQVIAFTHAFDVAGVQLNSSDHTAHDSCRVPVVLAGRDGVVPDTLPLEQLGSGCYRQIVLPVALRLGCGGLNRCKTDCRVVTIGASPGRSTSAHKQ